MCPKCGETKISKWNKKAYFGLIMLVSSMFLFLGILIFPLLVIGGLGMVAAIILPFFLPTRYVCTNCKHGWNPKKKTAQ